MIFQTLLESHGRDASNEHWLSMEGRQAELGAGTWPWPLVLTEKLVTDHEEIMQGDLWKSTGKFRSVESQQSTFTGQQSYTRSMETLKSTPLILIDMYY